MVQVEICVTQKPHVSDLFLWQVSSLIFYHLLHWSYFISRNFLNISSFCWFKEMKVLFLGSLNSFTAFSVMPFYLTKWASLEAWGISPYLFSDWLFPTTWQLKGTWGDTTDLPRDISLIFLTSLLDEEASHQFNFVTSGRLFHVRQSLWWIYINRSLEQPAVFPHLYALLHERCTSNQISCVQRFCFKSAIIFSLENQLMLPLKSTINNPDSSIWVAVQW